MQTPTVDTASRNGPSSSSPKNRRLVGLLVLAAGLGVMILAGLKLQEGRALLSDGIRTTGAVADRDHTRGMAESGKNTLYYRYTDDAGTVHRDRTSITQWQYGVVRPGMELDVVYDRDDPSTSIVLPLVGPPLLGEMAAVGVSGVFVLLGFGILGGKLKPGSRGRRVRDRLNDRDGPSPSA